MEKQGNLKLLTKIADFYRDILPVLKKFPKDQRYTLAQRIEERVLSCAEMVYFIAYQKRNRAERLEELRVRLHFLGLLVRLSNEQKFLSDKQYEVFSLRLIEMGRITSKWIQTEFSRKSENAKTSV
ncbi:MAG: four helix bundle protein [Alphaproteobacteria bacterium]|nr:four helix bundle protein [Alphaproteobacteria bacterium]